MRNYRFDNLGMGRKASLELDYLRTNKWLEQQAINRPNIEYLELSSLPMFDEVPVWSNQVTYYDEHHLNEVGIYEYAKEATPIIQKAIFND